MYCANVFLIADWLAQGEYLGTKDKRVVFAEIPLGHSVISMHFPLAASLKVMKSLSLQKGAFKCGFRAQKCFCDCFSKPGPACFLYKAYHVPAKFTAALKSFKGIKWLGLRNVF